ncbi:MAG: tyrosine--tRNA ligase [Caulobacterales bacterium]
MTAELSAFKPQSEFLRTMIERGHVHQCTDLAALDAAAKQGVTAYIGYDLTATSLHVGNLATIMLLRRLQKTGGKPIVLMGGGTTRVGDPSGKDEMRKMLTPEDIEANKASIKQAFARFLTFGDSPSDAIMVDNSDWLLKLNYIDFLRDVGRHFSINRMLSMDSVKLRLEREQPLSFIEFNYMVLQGYDFVELNRRFKCALQMGGSDQWGNIVNGVELGRRMDGAELFGLTTPLLTTSSGAKMGKTASGAVWLNADRLSPYDYWQFWRNTEDADVGRFLRLFTDLPMDEIERLEQLQGAEINDAKKALANACTAMLHGDIAAADAARAAQATFEAGSLDSGLPTTDIEFALLQQGLALTAGLEIVGLAASKSEAKRKMAEGAVRVNDALITDPNAQIEPADLQEGGVIKLSLGKKRHALLRVQT